MKFSPGALAPAVLSILALLTTHAPAQPAMAPEQDPGERLRTAVVAGALGKANAQIVPAAVVIEVNGADTPGSSSLQLIEAGKPVRLKARFASQEAAKTSTPATAYHSKIGLLRQTNQSEILWETGEDDTLTPAADGAMQWESAVKDGQATLVSVRLARLESIRGGDELANPDEPVEASIFSGRASVLLLPAVPFDRAGDGMLFGYNVGVYPNEASDRAASSVKDRKELYAPPQFFYRLDQYTRNANVASYFTLGMLNPAALAGPAQDVRYVALSPRLIAFLDAYAKKLTKAGLDPAQLVVLRGFTSPTERLRLERSGEPMAEFSRFQYGDAVAFIHRGKKPAGSDAKMGDVDGDGAVTTKDADKLGELAKQTMDDLQTFGAIGVGAKFSKANPTPYTHVDLRGWYTAFREE
ncbi:hypothetical protein BH09SUM1_BH09SUM1_21620 [soil metagenome]